jgi:hypothetical protein
MVIVDPALRGKSKMVSKRKILLVVGVAVAILIGVYTGVFGMAV